MKLHNRKALQAFTRDHPDAKIQIDAWAGEVESAEWKTPYDMKHRYPKASILGDQQTIFNICRNRYRMLTIINYKNGIVLVKALGTHKEYDKWGLK